MAHISEDVDLALNRMDKTPAFEELTFHHVSQATNKEIGGSDTVDKDSKAG